MKTITLEVPDDVADQVEAASEKERKNLADRFAAIVTDDGRSTLGSADARREAAERLRGSLKHTFKPGESGMAAFLEWREQERLLDDTY